MCVCVSVRVSSSIKTFVIFKWKNKDRRRLWVSVNKRLLRRPTSKMDKLQIEKSTATKRAKELRKRHSTWAKGANRNVKKLLHNMESGQMNVTRWKLNALQLHFCDSVSLPSVSKFVQSRLSVASSCSFISFFFLSACERNSFCWSLFSSAGSFFRLARFHSWSFSLFSPDVY